MSHTDPEEIAIPQGNCNVSNAILIDGKRVGYMYRDPSCDYPQSGWYFLSGKESQAYLRNPGNVSVIELSEFVAQRPEVVPYLDCPPETALERQRNGTFEEIEE